MKKYFITGLVILLPLALTIAIVAFIVNFLTRPFVGLIEKTIEMKEWYIHYHALIHVGLQIILLFLIFFFTVLLGFLARIVVFKSLLSLYDYVLHRIPLIKTVYKATQQVIKTIFGSGSRSFKQVVLVPFPKDGIYSLGFISSNAPALCEKTLGKNLLTVFVPTTPNPTSGFLIMYEEKDVVYVDMKIEDALKYVISCGVISSDEQQLPAENYPLNSIKKAYMVDG